jgi:hypothetical protein
VFTTHVVRAASAVALTVAALAGTVSAASAVSPAPQEKRVDIRFDPAAGQLPENLVVDADGSADVVFARSYQVAKVTPGGRTHVLATLPAPADGGVHTPAIGFAIATGLVKAPDGTYYVGYAAGDADLTGVWKFRPGGKPARVVALPADSFPNGIGLDAKSGRLYIADSARGMIWRAPARGGRPSVWSTARELARKTQFGANGLKVHNGAVWASTMDTGVLVRIPIGRAGRAGRADTVFTGAPGIDDFTFVGRGDTVLAANNGTDQVVLIKPDGNGSVVLTAKDGLADPTAVGIRHGTVYVTSADYTDQKAPNLLITRLGQAR